MASPGRNMDAATGNAGENAPSNAHDRSNPSSRRPRRRRPAGKHSPQKNDQAQQGSNATEGNEEAPSGPRRRSRAQRKKKAVNNHSQQEGSAIEDDTTELCILCAEPIHFWAIGECDHHGICSTCSLRMRVVMKDRSCPICKKELDRVIVSASAQPYSSFQVWGESLGADSITDEASDTVFFQCAEQFARLRHLQSFHCRVKKCALECHTQAQLEVHMKREHGMSFCQLCLKHQHRFLQEQEIYTFNGLKAHNTGKRRGGGPRQEGKDVHPMCRFCKKRYYTDHELFEHLERDHFKCHICRLDHEYFRNYSSLEAHFRCQHFICEQRVCLGNRFIVFENDIDYLAHMSAVHGAHNPRLSVNFQINRSAMATHGAASARATEAQDVPASWTLETSHHDLPVQREEAFPPLPPPATTPVAPALPPPVTRPPQSTPVPRPQPPPVAPSLITRNQRLAQALGLARQAQRDNEKAFEEELHIPKYPADLVEWGKNNASYLHTVERRLERVVKEKNCHSVNLRPMPADERALMHQLAVFYGVASESFQDDPRRHVAYFKRDTAQIPHMVLSAFIRKELRARSQLQTRTAPPPPPQQQQQHLIPSSDQSRNRGWERYEAPKPVHVRDAWSDDEDNPDEES